MTQVPLPADIEKLTAIRHDLHTHPELQFQEHRTAAIVARELEQLGVKVHTGIAGTGVIGTLSAGSSKRAIGIRADMDALPIHEQTNLPYASKTPSVMHACGHDGHTTMLLGAAMLLARDPEFDGTVHFIFQPAEEDISGAKRLIEEGLFENFHCDAVYALHNLPGETVGQVRVRPGPITAAVDIVTVEIIGVGGHGAMPHKAADPIVAASAVVLALQSIVARNIDPLEPAVITVGSLIGGSNPTIIPESCAMTIGVRSCTAETRALLKRRIIDLITAQAQSFGCRAEISYNPGISYPPGVNTAAEAEQVRQTALALGQSADAVDMIGPFMFSEDFAFMQEVKPSCYFGMGNGPSRNLHDAGYDFNDALLPVGARFWYDLVQRCLPKA